MNTVSKDTIPWFQIEIYDVRYTSLSEIVEKVKEEIKEKGYDPAQFDILENTEIETKTIGGSWDTYEEVTACFSHSPKYY